MKYQIAGTVAHVGELESIGKNGTPKRSFAVSIGNAEWPNDIALDLWKEAAENPPEVGQKIEADFYLQGRKWNDKYYVSLKCAGWKPDGAGQPVTRPAARKPVQSHPDARAEDFPALRGAKPIFEDEGDNLQF